MRTAVKKRLGFKNFYFYTAVNPKTGAECSLLAPLVNAEWLSLFLQELSESLQSKKAFVIMDRAPWHKACHLKIPENIQIIFLPPYSPELNPVERLWQYIKDAILKNRLYDSLGLLEAAACDFINSLHSDLIRSICHINYMSYFL